MEYIRFKDVTLSTQYGFTASETSRTEGKYKYLRITDIVPYFVNYETVPYCSIPDKQVPKYLVNAGDILIARTGATTGYNYVVPEGILDTVYASYLIRFVVNKEKCLPKFLKYVLKSKAYYGFVNNYIGGSAQPGMNAKVFGKFYIPQIPIGKQHRIASILSTYDTLIENNTKRIHLLEKMAENLYKEWFVRFRFPGHENVEFVKSKYGKLPNTFDIVRMNEVFDYYIGGGWGEEERSVDFPEEASVIRGADFPNVWHYDVSSCPRRYHKAKNYKARQLEDGDIVMEISGGTSEQPVGRTVLVTNELINRFTEGRVICASFCKLIRLNKDKVSPYYFYYWMKFLYDTRIIDRFQLQSTGIINFKFEPFLRKGDVMLPSKEVMGQFEKYVSVWHKEMNQLSKQNTLLARQRDLLLPRLMSGKLEVKAES